MQHLLQLSDLQTYRAETFKTRPDLVLRTPQQAIDFVNERGFISFWPIKNMVLPSLWAAAAGDRPVADDHDDPGHISWSWKDSLLDQHVWYYGRVLRHKNAFISHGSLPYFYALSPNFGSPEDDFTDAYQQGKLPLETKLVFDALLENGPLDSLSLRKAAHLSGKNSNSAFNHALDLLQMDFRLLPVGIAEVGSWRYAFRYDLTHRVYPELIDQARSISESQARRHLVNQYLQSVGVASEKEISHLFGWDTAVTHRTILSLVLEGILIPDVKLENSPDSYVCTTEISLKIIEENE